MRASGPGLHACVQAVRLGGALWRDRGEQAHMLAKRYAHYPEAQGPHPQIGLYLPFSRLVIRPMVDIVSEAQRSYNMSRIRSKNTKPELVVRSILHRMGYRFTVNGPKNSSLPGRPDVVLPKHRTVILVHGCFWHAHEDCKHYRLPKTRTEWWKAKLAANVQRDTRNIAELERLGWNTVVVWECEMQTSEKVAALSQRLPGAICQQSQILHRRS